jgi:osmotically-inducible protein OsmY
MKQRHGYLLFASSMLLASLGLAGCNPSTDAVAAARAASQAGGNVNDVDVTEHVKTALHQSDVLKSIDIAVVTRKGDVRLNGMVDSQAQVDEALRIARAADGAHSIHDELTIRK